MVTKKKVVKKSVKKVSKPMSEPFHFGNLNYKKKAISLGIVALFIVILTTAFPQGDVTGNAISDTIGSIGSVTDDGIRVLFGPLSLDNEKLIIYERFALFMLLFAIISTAASRLQLRGAVNLVVAGAISFISVFFMPETVLQTIGSTYSALYASILVLVPFLAIGYISMKIPKTKPGYGAKALIFFVMFAIFGMIQEGFKDTFIKTSDSFALFFDVIVFLLAALAIYSAIKAFTLSADEEARNRQNYQSEQLDNSFAGVIMGEVKNRMEGGAEEAQRRQARE